MTYPDAKSPLKSPRIFNITVIFRLFNVAVIYDSDMGCVNPMFHPNHLLTDKQIVVAPSNTFWGMDVRVLCLLYSTVCWVQNTMNNNL